MNKSNNIRQNIFDKNVLEIGRLIELAKLFSQDLLSKYSQSLDLVQDLQLVFGDRQNFDLLKEAWQTKDFAFPEIEIVNRNQINHANGAFARETNKIYLAQEFLLAY